MVMPQSHKIKEFLKIPCHVKTCLYSLRCSVMTLQFPNGICNAIWQWTTTIASALFQSWAGEAPLEWCPSARSSATKASGVGACTVSRRACISARRMRRKPHRAMVACVLRRCKSLPEAILVVAVRRKSQHLFLKDEPLPSKYRRWQRG